MCKDWVDARHCNDRYIGGSCYGNDMADSYSATFVSGSISCVDNDDCGQVACDIDSHYARELTDMVQALGASTARGGLWPTHNDILKNQGTCNKGNGLGVRPLAEPQCRGSAPDGLRVVDAALCNTVTNCNQLANDLTEGFNSLQLQVEQSTSAQKVYEENLDSLDKAFNDQQMSLTQDMLTEFSALRANIKDLQSDISDLKKQNLDLVNDNRAMSEALCTVSNYENNCPSKFYDAKFESGLWAHKHSPGRGIDRDLDTIVYSWKDNEIFTVYLRNPCKVTEVILYPRRDADWPTYTGINVFAISEYAYNDNQCTPVATFDSTYAIANRDNGLKWTCGDTGHAAGAIKIQTGTGHYVQMAEMDVTCQN